MLYDKANIFVAGGRGGDGCVSFRREAHVAKGGPDGGSGGRGGDVVLVADSSLRDLAAFRHKGHFKAGRGGHGSGALKHGADGGSLEVPVAVGTVVENAEGSMVFDLAKPGQRALVARGGSGGHGNKHFAGPTRQAPRFAEKGLSGEDAWLALRLKLLADIGLVGKPNAGKSSLLRRLTRARPKVAAYPFTTRQPVLGTIELDGQQLVLADIPGLIDGASQGAGLGHEFLAHIERAQLLAHVIDLAPVDGTDPFENYRSVEGELRLHNPGLAARPRLVALNKADLLAEDEADSVATEWRKRLGGSLEAILTSTVTGQGLDEVVTALFRSLPEQVGRIGQPGELPRPEHSEPAAYRLYQPAADQGFQISCEQGGVFRIRGRSIERMLERTDTANEEALEYLEHRLRKIGVIEALERAGFRSGDEVVIGDRSFELHTGEEG